jgi:hypothetical protein
VDDIRTAFWEAFRHLFPPRAKAVQTSAGALMISWPLDHDPHARFAHATPIILRFEDELLVAMKAAPSGHRRRMAERHEPAVRAGMVGYDPYAQVPSARVIVLG